MLGEKEIKEAESNVRGYLSEGLLKNKIVDENIINKYLKNSYESLSIAQLAFGHSSLWTIVCSYYSMYYVANALLSKIGYKVGSKISHKITYDSLIVFIRNKLRVNLLEDYEKAKSEALEISGTKAGEIIQSFNFELQKRSKFQYDMTEHVMKNKAQTSLERAKKFLFEMEKLL